jgi:hypothetical protein
MTNPYLLLGSVVGFVGGLVITVAGLRLGDWWIAVVGMVGAIAFGAALVFFGMAL